MIYPRVVRYVRTVRNVVAAAVFLVALALYGSRWPWGVALALALGFVARGLTTLLFPLPGTDLELRFDFATRRGLDSLRLASRLQDPWSKQSSEKPG